MNFQNLLSKMKQIDEGSVVECGDMPGDIMHPPAQQDSVTMNVSLNGSGAGGIRDLMDILHNIEATKGHHGDHSGHDIVIGEPGEIDIPVDETGDFEQATTQPDPTTLGVSAVTPTGDDLASKGGEAEKVNGGGNPMGVDESLVARLAAHYQAIKES